MLRTRQKLVEQQTELRKHLQALLRRNGLHYKAQAQSKTHWTKHHYCWLERTIDGTSGSLNANLELLLQQLKESERYSGKHTTSRLRPWRHHRVTGSRFRP